MSRSLHKNGVGVAGLERAIRNLAGSGKWSIRDPLPTTRELGEQYRISNASVCRLLKRLDDQSVLWRRSNGRYYFPGARSLLEKQKPYACLIRKLEIWSLIYQGIMTGFSQTFGKSKTGLLFIHDDHLVQHADVSRPPVHAGLKEQIEALDHFFTNHEREFSGMLLDDVWLDEAMRRFASRLENAVVVCRPTSLDFLSSVSIDYEASALIAFAHLFSRGYEEIWLARPFRNAASVDLMMAAGEASLKKLGIPRVQRRMVDASTPGKRTQIAAALAGAGRRVGLFCPEDNISALLFDSARAAGVDCPARVGFVSGMGTDIVRRRHLTSLSVDYEAVGRTAARLLNGRKVVQELIPTTLIMGETT